MFDHTVRSKIMGLTIALIIVMMAAATVAAVQVEASGPAPSPKAQTQTKDVSGVKTEVAAPTGKLDSTLTAETDAKVIADREMNSYSTVMMENNPELATVMATKVMEQQQAASTVTMENNPELATVMAAKVVEQQRAANHVADSVLPGTERWLTVADPLGRDFQLAYHYFLHQDYPAAATEIREGAKFLKTEETALEQKVPEAGFASDLAVRSATIDRLMRLADQVGQGKAATKDLEAAMAKAYQVDLEHGVSKLMFEKSAIAAL